MERIVFLCICMLLAIPGFAQTKKKLNLKGWEQELVWTKKERSNIAAVDKIFRNGDRQYRELKNLASEMIFYDVKMIANEDTGDTLVAVVDEYGNIRSPYKAFDQYLSACNLILEVTNDLLSDINDATDLLSNADKLLNLKNIEKGNTAKAWIGLKKAKKEKKRMYSLVKNRVNKGFSEQRKKIRIYIKNTEDGEPLTDPKLRQISELNLDPTDVLTKSEQEILDGLSKAKEEEDQIMNGPRASEISKALEETDK